MDVPPWFDFGLNRRRRGMSMDDSVINAMLRQDGVKGMRIDEIKHAIVSMMTGMSGHVYGMLHYRC